ncbi:MAG TPA: RHS repeat-associated core domain-containing protein [Myxococcales bacterium]
MCAGTPKSSCDDGSQSNPPRCEPGDYTCQCSEGLILDPVSAKTGRSYLRDADLVVRAPSGEATLAHIYSSDDGSWSHELESSGSDQFKYLPKPFGSSPYKDGALRWWTNYFAFVMEARTSQPALFVRDTDGHSIKFKATYNQLDSTFDGCGGKGLHCFAELVTGEEHPDEMLEVDQTAPGQHKYVLWKKAGGRLEFTKRWMRNDIDLYFLESIYNAQNELVASVTYANPGAKTESCERGEESLVPPPVQSDCASGAPFVRTVEASNGTTMTFDYEVLSYSMEPWHLTPRDERVLNRVVVTDASGAVVGTVRYQYRNAAAGEVSVIERPSGTTGADKESLEITYQQDDGARILRVSRKVDGEVLVESEHKYESNEPDAKVSQTQSSTEQVATSTDPNGLLQATNAYGFDGFGNVATSVHKVQTEKHAGQRDWVVTSIKEDCVGEDMCAKGTAEKQQEQLTGWVSRAIDKAGHATEYSNLPEGDWPYEKQAIVYYLGTAEEPSPPNPVMTTYGHDLSKPQHHRVESVTTAGLLDGKDAGTFYSYDADGRVTRTLRAGASLVDLNKTARRFFGTFQFYAMPERANCAGSVGDEKFVETHGPCEAASLTATDCAGDYPITQTLYYGAKEGSANQSQVREVRRFPAGCSSEPLVRQFETYDALGNVLKETDENGHSTTYEYQPGTHLMTKKTVVLDDGTLTVTGFGYDFGRLLWTKAPGVAGYDVECWRENTVDGQGCTGGHLVDVVQWKAKASDPLGANWSEKVVLDYWKAPGSEAKYSLKSEAYYLPSGLRRVKKYGADLDKRPVREGVGGSLSEPVAASYQTVRAFDHADHLKALGLPYNAAPAFCRDGDITSKACTELGYDTLDRLVSVTEYPKGTTATSTCFARDGHGDISKVATGCATCKCLEDPSTPVATYQFDDFGNVIKASLPNTGTQAKQGELRFVYGPSGEVVQRDSPALRADGWFYELVYDKLGRALSMTSKSTAGKAPIALWMSAYDVSAPACLSSANTKGRQASRTDSFGTTCFAFDAEGRLVREERHRADPTCGGSCANDKLDTVYTYDLGGRLTSITYPHGRVVRYDYYTDAGPLGRVKGVRVSLPGSGTEGTEIIRDVKWEPFGGMSSYSLVSPQNGSVAKVDYLLGDTDSTDPSKTLGCSYSLPATSDNSGRLRAIWVSKVADGDIYRRAYSWKADQIIAQDTCVSKQPFRETFSYDQALRLTESQDVTGGKRTWDYDDRGNRNSQTSPARSRTLTPGTGTSPDQLVSSAVPAATGETWSLAYSYGHDQDGRVEAISAPTYLGGSATTKVGAKFSYTDGSTGGIDAVFTSVTLVDDHGSGPVSETYSYFYDGVGRRWWKKYPTGETDEYLYDAGHQLLEDRGNETLGAGTAVYPIDEYVWLDGRPVALLRSKFDASWNRVSDLTGSCKRNSEETPCGLYFVVTDHIGKTAVVLDAIHRIVGAEAEGEPFGGTNRRELAGDSPHPWTGGATRTLASIDLGTDGWLKRQVRVNFAMVDVDASESVTLAKADGTALTKLVGNRQAQVWSEWADVPADGKVAVRLESGAASHLPTTGVSVEAFEYRLADASSAGYAWPRLRFPGHYEDAETGLFENWHRYYDPSIGRYLQPEPLMTSPKGFAEAATSGAALLPYAYAANNPLRYTDPTGLYFVALLSEVMPPPSGGVAVRGLSLSSVKPEPVRCGAFGTCKIRRFPEVTSACAAVHSTLTGPGSQSSPVLFFPSIRLSRTRNQPPRRAQAV